MSEPVTDPHIEKLESGTHGEKIEAMLHLGYAGSKRAFWYLVKNLNVDRRGEGSGRNEYLRSAAAEALGRLGDERAVPFLVRRYDKEQSDSVKVAIVFALSLLRHRDSIPVIQKGLSSDNERLVIQSMRAAAYSADRGMAAKIRGIVQRTDRERIRLAGIFSLIMLKDESAKNAEELVKGLLSTDPVMRYWTSGYLAETGRVEFLGPMIKAREIESIDWVRREMDTGIHRLAIIKKQLQVYESAGYLKDLRIEDVSDKKKNDRESTDKVKK